MIVFRSDAAADIMMFDDVARRMMDIMGREFSTRGILTVEQLPEAIARLPIPKVMQYQLETGEGADFQPGWTSVHFVRPAHGLVALHGADLVPVTALGPPRRRIRPAGNRGSARRRPACLRRPGPARRAADRDVRVFAEGRQAGHVGYLSAAKVSRRGAPA